ncbi:hypothetical protein JB92DRAFT_61849 [Gautieria morchelliformis]|nr:hypothetical protein JB92DRAFT_61849 [Gautieria morchelliformis]
MSIMIIRGERGGSPYSHLTRMHSTTKRILFSSSRGNTLPNDFSSRTLTSRGSTTILRSIASVSHSSVSLGCGSPLHESMTVHAVLTGSAAVLRRSLEDLASNLTNLGNSLSVLNVRAVSRKSGGPARTISSLVGDPPLFRHVPPGTRVMDAPRIPQEPPPNVRAVTRVASGKERESESPGGATKVSFKSAPSTTDLSTTDEVQYPREYTGDTGRFASFEGIAIATGYSLKDRARGAGENITSPKVVPRLLKWLKALDTITVDDPNVMHLRGEIKACNGKWPSSFVGITAVAFVDTYLDLTQGKFMPGDLVTDGGTSGVPSGAMDCRTGTDFTQMMYDTIFGCPLVLRT